MWSIFFLIIIAISIGIGFWLFFLWAVKSGQYDDTEGPKYRMLDDSDSSDSPEAKKMKRNDKIREL
jgi:cbb3-type cytochrome oxidase maturation protein